MGKKGSVDVYDFLYTLHFGVCHGPVDSYNQAWVKEKPIFCGTYTERIDLDINLPELFGGDDAEGGVRGVCELYMGGFSQLASQQLASRIGLTPSNCPGFRGLAHMLFRGFGGNAADLDAAQTAEDEGNVPEDYLEYKTQYPDSDYSYAQYVVQGGLPGSGQGWQWTTNNPYLPEMWVNVTALPNSLWDTYKAIWPITGVDESGNLIQELGSGTLDDVEEIEYALESKVGAGSGYGAWGADDQTLLPVPEEGTSKRTLWEVDIRLSWITEGITSEYDPPNITIAWAWFPDDGTGNPVYTEEIVPPGDWDYDGDTELIWINAEPNGGIDPVTFSVLPATRIVTLKAPPGAVHFAARGLVDRHPLFATGGPVAPSYVIERYQEVPPGSEHCLIDGELGPLPDANPAHIIYEIMTNKDWGKGESPALIDTTNFQDVSEVLYNEYFGLSFSWQESAKVEEVIQEVLDHIQAMLYLSLKTGLWTLKLLRDDYSTEGLRKLDETNAKFRNRTRRAWGKTINEIVVSYTDPKTEDPVTVSAHADANIAIVGNVNSEQRDYFAVRNGYLAQIIAERDVAEASYPLYRTQATVGREFWDIEPGEVVEIEVPEDEIESMFCRVMSIDYGNARKRQMTLGLVEDIYSVNKTQFRSVQTIVRGPSNQPADALPTLREVAFTSPLPLILRTTGESVAEVDSYDPIVPIAISAQAHSGTTSVRVLGTNGEAVTEFVPMPTTTLAADMDAAVRSVIPSIQIDPLFRGQQEVGDVIFVGTEEAVSEFIELESYDSGTGEWTVLRGVWDTVPVDWPAGTRMWGIIETVSRVDYTERVSGEEVTYTFLTRTRTREQYASQATTLNYTANSRPYLPFRPADTELDGLGFGTVTWDSEGPDPYPTEIVATWATRNRTVEDAVTAAWDADSVTPEAGQTTTIRVFDMFDVLETEYTGLTGTSQTIPVADLPTARQGYVEFVSVRGGEESLFNARRFFDIPAPSGTEPVDISVSQQRLYVIVEPS